MQREAMIEYIVERMESVDEFILEQIFDFVQDVEY